MKTKINWTKKKIKVWIRDVLILADTGELKEAISQLKFLYETLKIENEN